MNFEDMNPTQQEELRKAQRFLDVAHTYWQEGFWNNSPQAKEASYLLQAMAEHRSWFHLLMWAAHGDFP